MEPFCGEEVYRQKDAGVSGGTGRHHGVHGSSTLILLAYLYTNFFFLIPHTAFFRGSHQ